MRSASLFLLFSLFIIGHLQAQGREEEIIRISQVPAEGILLAKGWKYQVGDNPGFANADYDDSTWESLDPTQDIKDLPQIWQSPIISWFRLSLAVDTLLQRETLVLSLEQLGASEIYLNGSLLYSFGEVRSSTGDIRTYNPLGQRFALPLSAGKRQVLAVRFAFNRNLPYLKYAGRSNPLFQFKIYKTNQRQEEIRNQFMHDFVNVGFFLSLSILHLALFLFNPRQKANLYFFVFASVFAYESAAYIYSYLTHSVEERVFIHASSQVLHAIWHISILLTIYTLLEHPKGIVYWILIGLYLLYIPLFPFMYENGPMVGMFYLPMLFYAECSRIAFISVRQDKRGAWLIAGGCLVYLIFTLGVILITKGFLPTGPKMVLLLGSYEVATLAIPIALSLHLALEFAFTSRSLETKLVEVQRLSNQAMAQEQEKQQLLATQNETLEKQVAERTRELSHSLQELKDTQSQLIQKEKMASLGELTAGIAHEIQNPLNFMNNFSELNKDLIDDLQNELKTGNTKEAFSISNDIKENEQKINHHGKRADAIVKGMLQHSRASSGQKELTDINALAEEYLRLSYHGLKAKDKDFNAKFTTQFDESIGKIKVSPQDIGRVLLNLYNNAFYAVNIKKAQLNGTFEPTVKVSSKRVGDKVEISVKDNGTGIPQKVVDKIFQPFFTTKPTGQGTGLGLSLSYDIITKEHGSDLTVHSTEGEGTEFFIHLPLQS